MFRLLIVLVLSQAAIAASKVLPLVAVMPLDARKIDTTDALTLRDALSNDLIGTGEVRVMERAQIEAILKEQGFQQSGACDQNDCAVQVGKLLGIDRIVVGSVGKIGETYSVALRMVDVSTGEVINTASRNQRGQIDAVLTDLLPKVSSDLVRKRSNKGEPAEVSTASRSVWPWVVGGVVLTGGAAAAVVLLLPGDNASSPASPPTPPATPDQPWDATVTW